MNTPTASLLTCLALLASSSGVATAQGSRPTKAAKGRTVVVIVGVADYQDAGIQDLRLAEKDATSIHGFFAKDKRSRTTAERVHVLIGKQATRAAVLKTIRERLAGDALGPRDTAILFFAGRGISTPMGRYLAVFDTKPTDLRGSAIAWAELKSLWGEIKAGRRVFFADTHGSGPKDATPGIGPELAGKLEVGSAVEVIASGRMQADERNKHGVFTASLLAALEGWADQDQSGVVTLGEVISYMEAHAPLRAEKAGAAQALTVRVAGREAHAQGFALSYDQALKAGKEPAPSEPAETNRLGDPVPGQVFVYELNASGTKLEMRYVVTEVTATSVKYATETVVAGTTSRTPATEWKVPPNGVAPPNAPMGKTHHETLEAGGFVWDCRVHEINGLKTWIPLKNGNPRFPPLVRHEGQAMKMKLVRVKTPKAPADVEEGGQKKVDISHVKKGQVYVYDMNAGGTKMIFKYVVVDVTATSVKYETVTVVAGNASRAAAAVWKAAALEVKAYGPGAIKRQDETIELAGQKWRCSVIEAGGNKTWVPLKNGRSTFPPFVKLEGKSVDMVLKRID
ncbi:MAG: hypothetical protein JKY65_13100 [Planctomycetes bacterium]|nr:hypothetical protein [Planctomycetota bacterium]